MAYQLRERDPATLEEMKKGALSVEVNLMDKRARMKNGKRVSFREESTPSTSSPKMEKMMEEMMKKMSILERAQAIQNQTAPQNRNQNQNQNFRRNQPPNRPREDDQQITPPFHQNYVSEVEETNEESKEDDINMLRVDNDDFEIHYDRKQGLYTPYDDKRDDDEIYYQDMENVIIESQRE